MVPAGVRRAGGPVRPAVLSIRATRPGAAIRLGLAACLLAALACAAGGETGEALQKAPEPLAPEEGTTVEGRLRPGETALYSMALEEGQYLELHLNRGPDEVMAYLYGPGVEPTGSGRDAATWSELAPGVEGQVAWELAQATGDHLLLLKHQGEDPGPYRVGVTTLRPATSRDRARQRCDEGFSEAHALSRSGKLEQALGRFDETLELCREGEYAGGVGSTLSYRARVLRQLSRYERARLDFLEAHEVWSKVGDRSSMAGALVGLAGVERRLTNWRRAEELLEEGLRLAREAGARDVQANAFEAYCRIHLEQGATDRAIEHCAKALALWKEIERQGETAEPLNNLGYLYWTLGEDDLARQHYSRCERILDQYPDPEVRWSLRNNLALMYETEGQYQKALEEYQAAADGHEALGWLSDAGVALQNIGEIYHYRLRKFDTALDHYEHALSLMERANDPLAKILVLRSLGDLYQERGDLTEARRVLEEALELSQEAEAPPYRADSLLLMGSLLLAERNAEDAVGRFEEALELSRQTGNRWAESDALAGLGEALARLGREERGLDLLFEAATLSQVMDDRAGAAESRYRIARIERRRGNLEAARGSVQEALAVMEEVRTLVGSGDLRTLFAASTRPYHELYIDVLMAQHELRPTEGHDLEALRASEEARAQSLLEILAEAEPGPGGDVPESLLDRRDELLQQLNAKELDRQKLLVREETDPATLLRVKLDLERLLNSLREVERDIRTESPRYAALTHPQIVSVGEIHRSVVDEETALLEYSLGEERSFLWVVTDDALHTYELPGRAEIDRLARCLHWLITAFRDPPTPDSLPARETGCLGDHLDRYRDLPPGARAFQALAHRKRVIEGAFGDVASRLSEILLGGPARDRLLPFRLAVVSDGALEYVPFAALPIPDRAGRPLVTEHEVVRQPSASVLAFQRARPAPASAPKGEVAIVADPIYSLDDERLAAASRSREGDGDGTASRNRNDLRRRYTRLTYSDDEAELIARFVPEDRKFLALGADARRETVLSGALSGYRYVHFATHGTIDTRFPDLSSLVLSLVDDQGREHDGGYLRLNDIYGLDLDATDMVVLSACETALGREVRGEGLVGLTRGFLYAGAERVVASLWQVQDRDTARLMEHFYRGLLREERSPADALRRAQLAMLDEPGGSSTFPYSWAGFVLQGEWR